MSSIHTIEFNNLADKQERARRAVERAESVYDNSPCDYGDSIIEKSVALQRLTTTIEKYEMARNSADEYFTKHFG